MAPRSTTLATARSRPRCTAWCSSMPRPSSPRPKRPPAPTCRSSSKTSSTPSSNAASWPMASCGCAAPTAATTSWSRSAASAGGFAPRAARDAWRRPRRIWWTTSSAQVPVRQWVLSLPIPLRLLLAAQPKLVTPVLQLVHRVITRHLLGQAGLKAEEADSGAVTLIQRFGRRRWCAGVRRSRCAHRRRTARVAAHGHHPADEDAHAPRRADRGDGPVLPG